MINYVETTIPKEWDEGILSCKTIILEGCKNTREKINDPKSTGHSNFLDVSISYFELYEHGCLLYAIQHPDITAPSTKIVSVYAVYLDDVDEIYYLIGGQKYSGKYDEDTQQILNRLGKEVNMDCYEEYSNLEDELKKVSKINIFKLKNLKNKLLELKKEIDKIDEKKLSLVSIIENKIKNDTKQL